MLRNLLWHTDGLLGGKFRQLKLGWSNLVSYHSSLLAVLNVVNVFPACLKTWCWICVSAMLTISCQSLLLVFLPYYDLTSGQNILKGFFFFFLVNTPPDIWLCMFCQTHDLKTVCLYRKHVWCTNNTGFGTLCKLFS